MPRKPKYDDLREECIVQAMQIIEETGLENLSFREVARRLGVSHQAPYKHFENRDHILAEIITRAFDNFTTELAAQPPTDNPYKDMEAIGRAYLTFAQQHPAHYHLMFNTQLPDAQAYPQMTQSSQQAFTVLRDCLARILPDKSQPDLNLDAIFVWSTMHGLASLAQSDAIDVLSLGDDVLQQAIQQAFFRIGVALGE